MRKILLLIVLGGVLCQSCDNQHDNPVPDARISFEINLDKDPELIPTLGVKRFTERRLEKDILSASGIIVINGFGNDINRNLYAYDLACPVEIKKDSTLVRIVPTENGRAKCPKCNAIFNLAGGYGAAESGSPDPLRNYNVFPSGERKYIVRN